DVVYNQTFDEVLRQAVRSAKTPEDCCDLGELAQALNKLDEEIKEEQPPDVVQQPSAADVEASRKKAEEEEANKKKEWDFEESASSVILKKVEEANSSKTGDSQMTDADDIEKIKAAEKDVTRIFDANVTLCPMPDSEKKARAALQGSAVGKGPEQHGAEKKFTLIFVDPGLLGEPVTAPHIRINAVPQDKIKVLLRAVLSRFDDGSKGSAIHDTDLFLLFDNHLHYNVQKFQKKQIYLSYDEDSLRHRMGCVRGNSQFDQIEYLTLCSKDELSMCLPNTKRLIYPGSNSGNKIGDIELPPVSALWQLPCKVKHQIHGAFRVEAGGGTKGEEGPGRGNKRKTVDTVEPVFWRGRPVKFYTELKHSYRMGKCIDISVGDGTLAVLCAQNRIPYFGFSLNEKHAKAVRQRCIQVMLERKFTEGDKSYDPELAKLFKIAAAPEEHASKRPRVTGGGPLGDKQDSKQSGQQTLDEFKNKLE
ncbi:unnamed protein product, partial [Prorocentrum cordatum]